MSFVEHVEGFLPLLLLQQVQNAHKEWFLDWRFFYTELIVGGNLLRILTDRDCDTDTDEFKSTSELLFVVSSPLTKTMNQCCIALSIYVTFNISTEVYNAT